MTLLELKTLTVSWLDDPDFGYFTQSQVTTWLNNGLRELQKILIQAGENFYVIEAERSLVINQDTYVLPCSFSKVRKLELVQNSGTVDEITKTLYPITLMQEDLYPTQGDPQAYYLMKGTVVLRPVPQSTQWTLRMKYVYVVALMANDSDIPDAPEEYHEFIAAYAATNGLLKDGRDASLQIKMMDDIKTRIKQDSENRIVQSPRTVVSTSDDVVGVLF